MPKITNAIYVLSWIFNISSVPILNIADCEAASLWAISTVLCLVSTNSFWKKRLVSGNNTRSSQEERNGNKKLYLEKKIPLMYAEPSSALAPEKKAEEKTSAAVLTKEQTKKQNTPPLAASQPKIKEKFVYDFVKRACDIVCSFFGLIILSPLFLILSLLVIGERSGKGVFFKQKRLGKNGKYIYIYKFRSMVNDADNVGKWLNKQQLAQYYSEYKVENDPRVTKIGGFLRRTGLDELPQLLNILKGELSLVGPRPIQESETALYGEDKALLLSVKPGLTGYWQAYCSGDTTYTNKKRQKMELFYVKHRNLLWDLKICFATVGAIVRKAKRGQ